MLLQDRDWITRAIASLLSVATTAVGGCDATNPIARTAQAAAALPPAVSRARAEGTAVNPALVSADNAFGLGLLQAIRAQQIDQASAPANIAISPLSVSMALQILYNGAAGATQQAMRDTLQLGSLSTQQLNEANAALQATLEDADPQVQLTIANSLWTNGTVRPSFTQTDETYYGATLGNVAGAPDNVNAWVASETRGLITRILPSGDYSDVVAILANAVYFKGRWTTSFDASLTSPEPFSLSDGTVTSVPMMHQTGTYSYFQGNHFQMVRLPYGEGRLSMLIVLPDEWMSLDSLIASLSAEQLDEWVRQMRSLPGQLGLPRFTAQFQDDVVRPLGALGMGAAFCPGADFAGIAGSVCVSEVEHSAVVEVDETGTTAAAATGVVVITTIAGPAPFNMTMDHPFLYAIRDDATGELLFMGVLQNPGA
jgi:serine protease inhibitor